jgi:RNA polymerase sigma-70 factor, ECF subfamily
VVVDAIAITGDGTLLLTDRKTLAVGVLADPSRFEEFKPGIGQCALMDTIRLIASEIPRLRRYARALLRDDDRADDLVQETLLRGLDKLHLYRSGTDLRAWLFTVMHNQYVNHVRRWVRQRETIVIDRIRLAYPAAQPASLELRDVERAIQCLSDEQRTTLLLIALEGMRYEEVAQICNIPIGTVRSRLSRARRELRKMTEATDTLVAEQPVVVPRDRAGAVMETTP